MPSEGLSDGVFQVVFRNSVEKTERNKNVFMSTKCLPHYVGHTTQMPSEAFQTAFFRLPFGMMLKNKRDEIHLFSSDKSDHHAE
ncbi:hypothetical protein M703_02175 [Neisseria gonorrhoeae SK29344]|nr:hypothetical protein M680_11075 [Neisseria gonorrhoeae SK8976]KLR80678.1 hypothetical protein M679_01370 [Neisseria gonorrhoeae SK7842]KLR90695.1 hypothetical protein M677_05565 [Neisseria gonorrhoeae SK6987]KLR99287.1 hypothetical protein M674_07225 [Neisseria gonorrhoeae SK708]KLS07768.1 hypothetical protein M703_02175 [Neisseria gonorrhoeae SK29344]KLS34817.1 hypothetical protein M723_10935 [Neisseria gonorrhoeae ATL_2011_01_03]OIA72099.1 hypothetical protein BB035_09915 [Neisseria gono